MKHADSRDWQWHPKIRELFDALGLTWKVLPPRRGMTLKELGSSPGDAHFTGRTFVFEYSCPQRWVLHELAHWLHCREHRPRGMRLRNYGFDAVATSIPGIFPAEWATEESRVSCLTCGLERHLKVGDWRKTADELSLIHANPRQLRDRIDRAAQPIIELLPAPFSHGDRS